MSVTLEVVLNTARTYLNDDANALWTDAAMLQKAQQAHRQLQAKLRRFDCPVMKTTVRITVLANALFVTLPADLVEPITLWEATQGGALSSFVLMNERDPLPNVNPGLTLVYWNWSKEIINLISATANRDVLLYYWRAVAIPAIGTDLIGIINGELYLAPMTAALCELSTGGKDMYANLSSVAEGAITDVLAANKGRNVTVRP